MKVIVYTDGACSGNPGPGGYAAVMTLENSDHKLYVTGGAHNTTNNRMELIAVIEAIKAVRKPCDIEIYSDSSYVVDSINKKRVHTWYHRGWTKTANVDLWKTLIDVTKEKKFTSISFKKVQGHSGDRLNELADQLAVEMRDRYKQDAV